MSDELKWPCGHTMYPEFDFCRACMVPPGEPYRIPMENWPECSHMKHLPTCRVCRGKFCHQCLPVTNDAEIENLKRLIRFVMDEKNNTHFAGPR